MKLLVLPQLLHGGEVHSVDIDSTNRYVATAGNDALIHVWDFRLLFQTESINEDDIKNITPNQTLNVHASPVRVARWSSSEPTYLASGDVSGQLYLTNMSDMSHKLIYPWPSVKEQSAEIADIAWSADSRLLAWSTSDGKVHLYDLLKDTYQLLDEASTGEKNSKTTAQKSLAFNHSNSNLVTMGIDTFLQVYQYEYTASNDYQFKLTNKISKLMNNNPTATVSINYERISWSSDDEFFCVPSASKQHTSLISLLSRSSDWENKISLVGHDSNCDVVRFGPHIFQSPTDPNEPDSLNIYHIIASAGSDRTLALWNTSKESPLVVLREVSEKPVVDLCWDKSGNQLIMASLDGHLTIVKFDTEELGQVISESVLQKLKDTQKEYIKPLSIKDPESSGKRAPKASVDLIEQKNALKLSEAFTETEEVKAEELKVADGQAVDPVSENTSNSEIHGEVHPQVISSNTPGQVDDIMSTAMADRSVKTPPASATKPKSAGRPSKKAVVEPTTATQKTSVKNGKKRIQPMLISNGSTQTIKPTSLSSSSGEVEASKVTSKSLMEFDKPSYAVSEDVSKESKRNKAQDEGGPPKKMRRDLEPVKFIGTAVINPNTAFAKVRLSIPKVRGSFQLHCKSDTTMLLDVRNGQGNESAPSRVTCFKNESPIWTDFTPRYIQLATEGTSFWAICTADGQIITYTHVSGKRYLPPIVLGSPIVFLESHGDFLMAITAIGELYVWDMKSKKMTLHSPQSLASILDSHSKLSQDTLSKSDNVTMCSITSKGIPLVTLSNGSGYLYNNDMGVWQTVTEAWWAFGSHYWVSIGDDKGSEPQASSLLAGDNSSIVGMLEHKTNEEILRKSRLGRGKYFNKISKNLVMKEGFENLENTVSLSHMENRILCCELLGEFKDFHDFLITYSNRICELGLKAKLFELCEKLLDEGSTESSQICGYDRKELLKEIIFTCAKNRDAQRILQYFSKKLGLIEDEY